jgi:hypothetical protein
MEEVFRDKSTLGDIRGTTRKDFGKKLMDAVRDRDMVWNDAKRVLGHGHEIFYFPSDKEGKKKPRLTDKTPMTVIKKLTDVLSLIRWRQEPEAAHLLPLTDEQKQEIVHTLRTLHVTLKAHDIESRDVTTKANLKEFLLYLVSNETKVTRHVCCCHRRSRTQSSTCHS